MDFALRLIERLALTLWVGGLWVIGYVAAPLIFATLDDVRLAGTVAGRLFTAMSWIGLLCGLILIGLLWRRRQAGSRPGAAALVVAIMLVLTVVGEFGLHPIMQGLRDAASAGAALPAHFGRLHEVSSLLFLAVSLLGLVLVGLYTRRDLR